MKKTFIFTVLFSLIIGYTSFTQNNRSENTSLSVEKIMQDPEIWIGSLPDDIFWSEDSKTIYFDWNPENKPMADLFKVNIKHQQIEKVPTEEKTKLPPSSASINKEKTMKVFVRDNGLYLYNIKDQSCKLLVKSSHSLKNPEFTHSGDGITFLLDNDFYKWSLNDSKLILLADFEMKPKPQHHGSRSDDQAEWLKNQQSELFKTLERQKLAREYRDSVYQSTKEKKRQTIYTGQGFLSGVSLSPDEKFVTYNIFKRGASKSTKVPHFVSETGYLDIEDARSKVGGDQHGFELHIYDIENDTILAVQTENIPGIKDQPEYLKEYQDHVDESKPREVRIFGPYWSDNGEHAFISVRSADSKDRWLLLLDPHTGNVNLLDRQRDEAWIAGPGISRSGWYEDLGWLPDNEHIWYQSEESGYAHIHIVNIHSKKEKQLTKGDYEIYNPTISKNGNYWYFQANKEHPGERHYYKMPLMGGKPEQLTFMEGRTDVSLSPDEKYLAIRHSASDKPWELYLKENNPDAKPIQITFSLQEGFKSYNWRKPEVITFKADDGAKVYARLYKPQKTNENKNPAVIFVHGAGYKQNAHKWWSSYFREYMFHNLLVDKGYTVLDIDYRGSAGYGSKWRTGIYRHMGGKDLSDHVDGAEFLVKKHNVDPEKIGIYGGSYGGFITLMALFKNPETFAAGAALRSVTDWAHYNHSYTSNILNEPSKDSIAYRRSSPIYFAEGLEDPLLICHGMIDENVQFQDVVRLTQRFIELGKEDWELAVYPMERHSFTEPESWTDEYKRILKLFEQHLK